jgi:hypothetical protein
MTSDSLGPFGDLAAIGAVFARTRGVLDTLLNHGSVSDEGETVLSDAALPHIESVEAAFRARLRAGDADLEQLRDLVRLGGLGPPPPRDAPETRAALIEAIRALSGAGGERRLVRPVGRDLAALDHAQLAMALVPRTPRENVRFPGWGSYADISPPRTPTEFVARIEEVERHLWHAAAGRGEGLPKSGWRRVYAFFDTGEALASTGFGRA